MAGISLTARVVPLMLAFGLGGCGATIVPLAIRGAYDAMPRGSVFPRPCPIALAFAPPIHRSEYQQLGDEQLTQLVESRIEHLLINGAPTLSPNNSRQRR